MDRLQFVSQMNCHEQMISDFDYMMSIYSILDIYKNDIQTTFNTNTLCFELKLPSEKLANKITDNLNITEISNYNSRYKVEAEMVNDIINLKLNKVSG